MSITATPSPAINADDTSIRPFRASVPQADLDDLHARLETAHWPDELPDVGGAYGVPGSYVRQLVDHWLHRFDWRALEDRLNAYPQFVTRIDGHQIHFLHVRSDHADATPLVLTHSWPGSVLEYLDVIDRLTNPVAHGGRPEDAFHVVVPSIPGFGFSGPTTEPGWDRYRIARAWIALMERLGYDRYGAVGNDAGSFVAPEIGRFAPDRVIGVHVTQLFSFPSGDPAEFAQLSATDLQALERLQWFNDNMSAFNQLQAQQPQTLAYALTDSPIGLLGWNAQLLPAGLDLDFVIGNVALYWLTRTAASSIRFYYEDARPTEQPSGPTIVPTALAMFADDFQSIRPFAERDHTNIVSWTSYDQGGHYAAVQLPDVLVGDIRRVFAGLRADRA